MCLSVALRTNIITYVFLFSFSHVYLDGFSLGESRMVDLSRVVFHASFRTENGGKEMRV